MSVWIDRIAIALLCGFLAAGSAAAEAIAVYSATGPEAVEHGSAAGYPTAPFGVRPTRGFLVGYHTRMDTTYPHNVVHRGPDTAPLRRAGSALNATYTFRGQAYTVADYPQRHPTTGLLIARGDAVHLEHYGYARTDRDRFLSQSMAKTVTAMLVGIAIAEGAIRSIDQTAAAYVPELSDTLSWTDEHPLSAADGIRRALLGTL